MKFQAFALSLLLPLLWGLGNHHGETEEPEAFRPDSRPLVVASKNFTENRLLAEILAQTLKNRLGVEVIHRQNLGATAIVAAALRRGDIDLYPEYTGTAWTVHLGIVERIANPLHAYLHVRDEYRKKYDLHWLLPFGFENSFAIAVRKDFAEEHELRNISDLSRVTDRLRIGLTHEFLEREDGWGGLVRHYDLDLKPARGMEHTLAYTAIARGEVDLIDTWTTDGKLLELDLVLLADDRGYFPPYDCAPVIRGEILRRFPRARAVLEELGLRLDAKRMQRWNARVESSGRSLESIAAECLAELDFGRPWYEAEEAASGEGRKAKGAEGDSEGPARWTRLARYLWEHLVLTGVAVLLAALIAIPGGIALSHRPRTARIALVFASVLQTIPSLALLTILIPFFGLGLAPAMAALFLYALLPILRNTTVGIASLDPDLDDAARGLGLTSRQRLLWVAVPLAMPTIMAGLRTATVTSVGIATLAAFIGAGGLGEPIVIGLQLDDQGEVLFGAIPAALLAIVLDRGLGLIESRLARRKTAALARA